MAGGWGYGVKGVGPGGGCATGCGIIGTGNYGLIGHGSGTGVRLRHARARRPAARPHRPTRPGSSHRQRLGDRRPRHEHHPPLHPPQAAAHPALLRAGSWSSRRTWPAPW